MMNENIALHLVDAHDPDWTHTAMSMTRNYFLWMNDQLQHTCDFSISDIVGMPLDDYIASASNDICPKDSRCARFYLLVQGITPVSMGGWRILPSGDVEIVRVYTRPEHRGHGYGRLMLKNLIAECHQRGFRKIKLDTGCFMKEAQSLYRSLGFIDCAAYEGAEPPAQLIPFWLYMELDLTKASEAR
ncbi:MAG: hypothetical protein RI904_2789 [Pseudomonadota bacterium]